MNSGNGILRWLLKKTSRGALAYGSSIVRHIVRSTAVGVPLTVRALTYHRFGDVKRDPFCVAPAEFERQMQAIARTGLAISLSQMEEFLSGEAAPPPDAVLVTVDDGFRSLRTVALPVLEHYAIPAVAFITPGKIAERRFTHGAPEDYLSWSDLAFLVNRGLSIQSHAWSHRSLPDLSTEDALEELICSKEVLSRRLGKVSALAYPFGTRADFNERVVSLVAQAGYRLAFTSQHGPIRAGDDRLRLARTKVERGETTATFASLVHGGLDAWRWIDSGLWRIQASGRGHA
jgi:peptidoglycan/xylan/chitin deacetylase (PgdA/CDA1 family)